MPATPAPKKKLTRQDLREAVYEYLLVAPAIPITGVVGSPVKLLAIK